MALNVIADETTGEILRQVIVASGDVAANVDTGEVSCEAADPSDAISIDTHYVDDPGGTPAVAARPTFDSVIPTTVSASANLSITDVPNGANVSITSTGGGDGEHTKTGGLGTLDASIAGAAAGDILTVVITLWPYQPMSGDCTVTA